MSLLGDLECTAEESYRRSEERAARFDGLALDDRARFAYEPVAEVDCGGAAVDYAIDAGTELWGVGRCCVNCRLIVCRFGEGIDGCFALAELRPLNDAAREMLASVEGK